MSKFVKNFIREEEGASLVEYGLLVALIAVASIAALGILGGSVRGMFERINTGINTGT